MVELSKYKKTQMDKIEMTLPPYFKPNFTDAVELIQSSQVIT